MPITFFIAHGLDAAVGGVVPLVMVETSGET
jgi:hypothetical protein